MKSSSEHNNQATGGGAPAMLSQGLGWFSIALGAGELLMPRGLASAIGIEDDGRTPAVIRMMGVRGLVAGVGVLLQPRKPMALWSRVFGDMIDLGLLGYAHTSKRTSSARLAGAIISVLGVTALDVFAAARNQKAFAAANEPVIFSVTINKPRQQVYAFYRRLQQLPLFMDYLESVTELGGSRSRWVAKLPLAGKVEWEARLVEDRPGELIAWESVEGSPLKTSGRVTFTRTPGRDMTEVRVEMKLGFTGVHPTTALAKFFAKPQVKGDLRRFKQVMETGEVLLSDASAHTRPHPAQPSATIDIEKKPMVFIPTTPTAEKGVTR